MRITDVEAIALRAPMENPDWYDGAFVNCVIRVRTDEGITGAAEVDSAPEAIRAIVAPAWESRTWPSLRSAVLGMDPLDPPKVWQAAYDALHYYGRRGVSIHALSGLDLALWDLKGRAEGKPVAELLGEKRRSRVPAYVTTSRLGQDLDSVRQRLDHCLATKVRALKISSDPDWGRDPAFAVQVLDAARRHVGPDIALMFDAFGCFKTAEAAEAVIPVLRENGYRWFEAPVPVDDVEGHARLTGQGVPIAGGDMGCTTRFEYADMIRRGRVDIVQPDATMVGGLTEMRRVAELARAEGRRIIPHGFKGNFLIAANLAFLAQHWNDEPLEYSMADSPLRWNLSREEFPIGEDGKVAVPDQPGIGATLNEVTLQAYRVK